MIMVVGRQKSGDQQSEEYSDLVGHGRGLARPDVIGKGCQGYPGQIEMILRCAGANV